jgi:hypothetical protein
LQPPLSHHRTCFIASGGSPRNRQDSRVTASCLGHSLAQHRGRLSPLAESRQLHCLRPASSSSIRSILPSSPVPRAAQVPVLLDVRPFPMPSHRYYDLCWLLPPQSNLTTGVAVRRLLGSRSPHVRTLTFPAPLPHLSVSGYLGSQLQMAAATGVDVRRRQVDTGDGLPAPTRAVQQTPRLDGRCAQ